MIHNHEVPSSILGPATKTGVCQIKFDIPLFFYCYQTEISSDKMANKKVIDFIYRFENNTTFACIFVFFVVPLQTKMNTYAIL